MTSFNELQQQQAASANLAGNGPNAGGSFASMLTGINWTSKAPGGLLGILPDSNGISQLTPPSLLTILGDGAKKAEGFIAKMLSNASEYFTSGTNKAPILAQNSGPAIGASQSAGNDIGPSTNMASLVGAMPASPMIIASSAHQGDFNSGLQGMSGISRGSQTLGV